MREIQAAISLSRKGGFAGAATELGITQPAVSHRIAKLEQLLGLSMFHRRQEGTTLTDEGRLLCPLMVDVENEFEKVLNRVSYWKRANRSKLNVIIDGSLVSQAIHLKAHTDGFAGFDEDWRCPGDYSDWIEALRGFSADLVIAGSFLGAEELEGIRTIPISRERGVTAAWNPDYYFFDPDAFSFPDAVSSTVILPAERMAVGFRKFITNWCMTTYGYQLARTIEANTEADAIQVCKLGMGVLLLPGDAESRLALRDRGLKTSHSFRTLLPDAYTMGVRLRSDERNPQVLETAARLTSENLPKIPI